MIPSVGLLVQQVQDLHARSEVELARRLVREQHRVAGRERPRDRDTLLLAAGELMREMVDAITEPDPVEHRDRTLRLVAVRAG